MNVNDCLSDLFGKNSTMILSDIDKIRSLGQSFNFTVSEHKKFTIALRNAEMSLRKNSAFLNFISKNQNFYLFVVFKQFIQTGNKLDTFEEYYTKFVTRYKNKISTYGLQFFKLYKQSFEEIYKIANYLHTAKSIVTVRI
jgi:hypothetical protein